MELHAYLGLKLLHVLAVVLFLGNITTGVFALIECFKFAGMWTQVPA